MPREFQWQYRALRERVSVLAECLDETARPPGQAKTELRRAETAIDISLQYFENVLNPKCDIEN